MCLPGFYTSCTTSSHQVVHREVGRLPGVYANTTALHTCCTVFDIVEQILPLSMQAERLVSKFEELGQVTGDLGLSAIKLAKFEDTDGSTCGSYTDSAMASKTISADSKQVGKVSCTA